jgi:amino acid adenylation domain-containing protein
MNASESAATFSDVLKNLNSDATNGITFISGSNDESFLSYQDLYKHSVKVLCHLQRQGLMPGNELIFKFEDNRNFIITFWACILGGIIPVPVSEGNNEDQIIKLVNIFRILRNPYLIGEQATLPTLVGKMHQHLNDFEKTLLRDRIIKVEESLDEKGVGIEKEAKPDDLAYIQFSSGSTGTPKGVMLTHFNLLTNTKDITTRSQTTQADNILSWMPLTHDMGLICFHLSGILLGVNQFIMPTSLFIRRPGLWIDKAHQHKINQLYSPNFGLHYFLASIRDEAATPLWDLSNIRLIYNGAEPISFDLCQQFLKRLAGHGLRENAMFPGYGLAEASVAVSLPFVGEKMKAYHVLRSSLNYGDKVTLTDSLHPDALTLVETGAMLDHCAVRVEVNGNKVKNFVVGEILVKGGNVTSGYYNDEVLTNKARASSGWLKTGDVGFLNQQRLVITGRLKNIIIVNGQNYYPHDLECTISKGIPEFDLGKVVCCALPNGQNGDDIGVFLLFKKGLPDFISYVPEVKRLIALTYGLDVKYVLPVKRILKTTSGKVQNFKLVDQFRKGEFNTNIDAIQGLLYPDKKTITTRNKESMAADFRAILKSILACDAIADQDNLFEAGLNSVSAFTFINRIESSYGICISVSQLFDHPTLDALLQYASQGGQAKQNETICIAPHQNFYPVTPVQKRFWMAQQMDKDLTAFNLTAQVKITGPVNVDNLEKAFNAAIRSHEILRTVFPQRNEQPVQKILSMDEIRFSIARINLTSDASDHAAIDAALATHASKPFQIDQWPLLRVNWITTGTSLVHYLSFSIHHIITDGWSVGKLLSQVRAYYEQLEAQEIPTENTGHLQFKDYATWHAMQLNSNAWQSNYNYWRSELQGSSRLQLPISKPRPILKSYVGDQVTFSIGPERYSALKGFSIANQITDFVTVCAAVRVLLFKYSGQGDLVIGSTVAGRTEPAIENVSGCFINTLPLRVELDEAQDTVLSVLGKERAKIIKGLDCQHFSFDQLESELALTHDLSRAPGYDALIIYQNLNESISFKRLLNNVHIKELEPLNTPSLVDLEFEFSIRENNLDFTIRYTSALFEQDDIRWMGEHLMQLLDQFITHPAKKINDLELVTPEELTVLKKISKPVPDRQRRSQVIELFKEQAKNNPKRIAIKVDERTLTYRMLNEKIVRLANCLKYRHGLKRGDRVGIMMKRNENAIVSLLTSCTLGLTYVPIDADNPTHRIQFIHDDAGLSGILTDNSSLALHPSLNGKCIQLEESLDEPCDLELADSNVLDPDDIAYILYTSGSTGKPKGVLVSYANLANYIATFTEYFNISENDRVIQQSSLSFDVSVEEIFPIVCCGGCLIVATGGGSDIESLASLVEKEGATVLSTTPLVINELNKIPDKLSSLRILISGGDVLKPSYIANLYRRLPCYNTYGPTETTVCVAYNKIDDLNWLEVIGSPLVNHEIRLLDSHHKPAAIGVPGELFISGAGVSSGYLNLESETQHAFTSNREGIWYKTGDTGVWLANGKIKFIGRRNNQVKWRGYRIEPAEIEKAILLDTQIKNVLVAVAGNDPDAQLVAYLVSDETIDSYALSDRLLQVLPSYMIPGHYVQLEKIPVTRNGKVDHKLLPPLESREVSRKPAAPQNKIESALLEIWQEVFRLADLSTHDNFYSIGGQSLIAARICARIQSRLSYTVSLRDVLVHPTVRQLADAILSKQKANGNGITPASRKTNYVLSSAQRRLWMLNSLSDNASAFNLIWKVQLKNAITQESFASAIKTLIARHESLRTIFRYVDNEPRQIIIAPELFDYSRVFATFTNSDPGDYTGIFKSIASTGFDLEQGPLLRVCFLNGDTGSEAVIAMHHIITDGWSMVIFRNELTRILNAMENNSPLTLPSLAIQYKDFAEWESNTLRGEEVQYHKKFWTEYLNNARPVRLKNDHALSSSNGKGKSSYYPIPPQLAEYLNAVARRNETTLFNVCLNLWNILIYKRTGNRDVVLSTLAARRNQLETEGIIGYFLNVLPVRSEVDGNASFSELLARCKQNTGSVFEHQDHTIDYAVLNSGTDNDTGSLINIMLVVQNFNFEEVLSPTSNEQSAALQFTEIDPETSMGDLLIEINFVAGQWRLKLRYDSNLFRSEEIDALAGHLFALGDSIRVNEEKPIKNLSILTADEKVLVLKFSTGDRIPYITTNVLDAVERRCRKHPDHMALVCDSVSYTYEQVNTLANQFARYLLATTDVEPGDHVCVVAGRSEKVVIIALALFKIGAVYVPVDSEYPSERRDYIVRNACSKMLIADDGTPDSSPRVIPSVSWNEFFESRLSYSGIELDRTEQRDNAPAYIMYTSGSSGKPKGVVISHFALMDYIHTFVDYFRVGEKDKFVQQSSISFDISIEEIFTTLSAGACLVVAPQGGRNIDSLIQLLNREQVTLISTTPLVINELNKRADEITSLKTIISGGDVLRLSHVDKLVVRMACFNTYGPTEVTVCATYNRILSLTEVQSIGKPIPNHKVFILDSDMNLLPPGVPGELYVGGPGLADGYFELPEETSERFRYWSIDGEEQRLYRTGDSGDWTRDGKINFGGRLDNQLKINGYRVEIQEVEVSIMEIETVTEVIVMNVSDAGGHYALVAFFIADRIIDDAEIHSLLLDKLPVHMVPTTFVQVDIIPLTPNGKTDQDVLRQHYLHKKKNVEGSYQSDGEIEKILAGFWKQILGLPEVSSTDNFFESGGQSIAATQLLFKINAHFEVNLALADIFRFRTLREQGYKVQTAATQLVTEIKPVKAKDWHETTNAQKRIWFLDELASGDLSYSIFWAFTIEGKLDLDCLRQAFLSLYDRHESLRTVFRISDGNLQQHIGKDKFDTFYEVQELENIAAAEEVLRKETSTRFDLFRGPLTKVKVLRVARDQKVVLFLNMHHIVSDGWSLNVLVRDLKQYYFFYLQGSKPQLQPLAIQYKDYAVYLNSLIKSKALRVHQAYWKDKFSDAVPVLNLPTQRKRASVRTNACGVLELPLDHAWMDKISKAASLHQVSQFAFLLASFKLLLYRYTHQNDLVVGTPVSGRLSAALADQVGCFVNTLALRSAFPTHIHFSEFLKIVNDTFLGALEHQVSPFDELVDSLRLKRDTSRSPLFDVMIVLHETHILEPEGTNDGTLKFNRLKLDPVAAKFDLTLNIFKQQTDARLLLEYNSDLFDREFIQTLLIHFKNIVTIVADQADLPITKIDFLTTSQKEAFLNVYNKPITKVNQFSVLDMFEKHASANPDKTILLVDDRKFTFRQVRDKANALAWRLTNKFSVKSDRLIGLITNRNENMVIGMLGILKAQAAYVPIDPTYPAKRIDYIFQDSAVCIAVVEDEFRGMVPEKVFCVPVDVPIESELSKEDDYVVQDLNSPAYLIYTSGSTGLPKGVLISRRNFQAFMDWSIKEFSNEDINVVYAVTSYCFDLSVFEVFYALCLGKELRILKSGLFIGDFLPHDRKVLLNTVPSVVEHAIAQKLDLSNVSVLNMAGEPIPLSVKNNITVPHSRIRNLYGPSEDTTYSTCYKFQTADEIISIGKPIDNTAIYILDSELNFVPQGVAGEINIVGEGVALGYLNNPDQTTSKFVQCPFNAALKMYRTGDLGRLLPNGDIEFLGRVDNQVKIRGYRVELGEIEARIEQFPSIQKSVAMVKELNQSRVMIVYFTGLEKVDKTLLGEYLAQYLPNYLLPDHLVQLEKFPQTSTGKVDRNVLKGLDVEISSSEEFVSPETVLEKQLAELWEELFHQKISVTDNFFSLGGHSLKAAQLVNAIKGRLHYEIELRNLFTHPTIKQLADVLEGKKSMHRMDIPKVDDGEFFEPSSGQRRLWIVDKIERSSGNYNMSGTYKISGNLDLKGLQFAFDSLVKKYEILRTSFVESESGLKQKIYRNPPPFPFQLTFINDEIVDEQALIEKINTDSLKPFQLDAWPLIRLGIYQVDHVTYLSITIHHIVCDGLSMPIIVNSILSFYKAHARKEKEVLTPLKLQFKDFSAWQNALLLNGSLEKERAYWLARLKAPRPVLNLPGDFKRPARKTFAGERMQFVLSELLSKKIRSAAQKVNVTPFMFLMAAVQTLFYKYTGETDIIVGTVTSGRPVEQLNDQIGFFVNTLPIRNQLIPERSVRDLISAVSHSVIEAFEHQNYPFDKLVEELGLKRNVSRSALFDVMILNENDQLSAALQDTADGIVVNEIEHYNGVCKYDLTFTFIESDSIGVAVEFNKAIFSAENAIGYFNSLKTIVECFVDDLDQPLNRIQLDEHDSELQVANAVRPGWSIEQDVVALFERQATATPLAPALSFEGTHLTYQELNEKANRLAWTLHQEYGVCAEDRIGILLNRSENLIVAILGILKAGAAYVPIDPAIPEERKKFIYEDSDLRVLITGPDSVTEFPKDRILSITQVNDQKGSANLNLTIVPANLIYVIYTSGTSGKPKGVLVEHRSVVNLVHGLTEILYADAPPSLNVLLSASIHFDSSVKQIFPPLLCGAHLHVLSDERRKDPGKMLKLIVDEHIDIFDSTPSYLHHILQQNISVPPRVKYTLVGGEPFNQTLVSRYFSVFGADSKLVNLYGLTETTVDNCYHIFDSALTADVPLGKALPNNHVFVLDNDFNKAPKGVEGEICIGGCTLARGYLNRPELTHSRFVEHPSFPAVRIFRTGDFAKWNSASELIYINRKDNQIKIRGFRVELREIENVLCSVEGIDSAFVNVHIDQDGDSFLAAYVVHSGKGFEAPLVKKHLVKYLPEYMIPARIIQIPNIPLTVNGKIDVKALPAPNENGHPTRSKSSAVMGLLDQEVLELWEDVLHRNDFGITDNFFELGGTSLKVINLHSKLNERYPGAVEIHQLFSSPTVKGQVEILCKTTDKDKTVSLEEINVIEF